MAEIDYTITQLDLLPPLNEKGYFYSTLTELFKIQDKAYKKVKKKSKIWMLQSIFS